MILFFNQRYIISLENLKLTKILFKNYTILKIPLYSKDIKNENDLNFILDNFIKNEII